MAILIHEVWEAVSDGMILHTCCLAGPRGDQCRRSLESGARLLTTFEAGSHFEAMTIYNSYLGREAYTTNEPWDHQPYPDEWLAEIQKHIEPGIGLSDQEEVFVTELHRRYEEAMRDPSCMLPASALDQDE